ncbi:unnamed protein product [Brachionus calyciflorus]|uniref:Uncharacterized protein n=1 Tax=Brachionus calyciflorus TaxID=104777 RepID=A0A814S0M2_9BILA|nr:unnamed protein product [Brachionus calyciflorus]
MNIEADKLNDLKKDFELKFQDLRCFLNENDTHFLNEPKVLPCLKTACIECIEKLIINSKLKCNFCNDEHYIENVNELKSNDSIIDKFNSINQEKNDEIGDKLNELIQSLLDECTNRDQAIENLCSQAKKEVSLRIKACKDHLDVLHQQMLDQLATIKQNVMIELQKLDNTIDEKSEEYRNYITKMENMMEHFDQNREELFKEIYNCQKYIDDLTCLDDNFRKIMRKISFEPSEWVPDESFVYPSIKFFNSN